MQTKTAGVHWLLSCTCMLATVMCVGAARAGDRTDRPERAEVVRVTSDGQTVTFWLGCKIELERTLTGNGWSLEGTQKMKFGDRKVDAKKIVCPDGKKVYLAITPAGAFQAFFYADVEYNIRVEGKQDEFSPPGENRGGEDTEILIFGRRLNNGFSAMTPSKGGDDYAALTLTQVDGVFRAVTRGRWSRDSAVELVDVGDAVAGYVATRSNTRFMVGENGVQILNAGGCVKDSKAIEYCGERKGGKVKTTIRDTRSTTPAQAHDIDGLLRGVKGAR